MSKTKTYKQFVKIDNLIVPVQDATMSSELPPGMYQLSYDPRTDAAAFIPMESKHDKIVNLDSGEYAHVMKDIQQFLTTESKDLFKQMGFLYKNSFLLHGKPGVGKTIIVNMLARHIIEKGGVVLFDPDPRGLPTVYSMIEQIKPGQLVMIIFEELEQHLGDHERELLSILDGETQKDNVVYVATTNFIDQIPPRIMRPGRFATVIEVHPPSKAMREQYLRAKLTDENLINTIMNKTEGFTIDELKEIVRAVVCLKHDLVSVTKRLKQTKDLSSDWDEVQEKGESPLQALADALIGARGGRNVWKFEAKKDRR